MREAVGVLQGLAGGGSLDADVVDALAANREQAAAVRRLAQEGASDRYLAFLQHQPVEQRAHSAA